eukprot:606907-Prorocentrum_minimum.AAC.1
MPSRTSEMAFRGVFDPKLDSSVQVALNVLSVRPRPVGPVVPERAREGEADMRAKAGEAARGRQLEWRADEAEAALGELQ